MSVQDTRINKLRIYLFNILDSMLIYSGYQINANMLSNDINNYSLDKVPEEPVVENWIIGNSVHRDVYSFRSRCEYSQDTIINLENIGFFEDFEEIIAENNKDKILPDIDGIESIKCLNCGSMNNATTNTAEFDIQLEITYRKGGNLDETDSIPSF